MNETRPVEHLDDQATQVAYGPDQPNDHAGVGHVGADGDGAVDGHERTDAKAQHHLEAAERVRNGPVERMHPQQTAPAVVLFLVDGLELLFFELLTGKGFDHAHAAQVLLQGAGEYGLLLLVCFVARRDLLEEEDRHDQNKRDDDHGDERQPPVDEPDRNKVYDEEHENATAFDGLFGKEAAQRVDIRCGALDQLAGLVVVMVGEAEALDLVVQIVAHTPGDALRRAGRQPSACEGEDALHDGKGNKPEDDERQLILSLACAEILVNEVGEQQEGRTCAQWSPGPD